MVHICVLSLKNSNVKAMYDCTFYVENDLDVSIAHWLKGQPSTISLVCSRIDLSEIPTDRLVFDNYGADIEEISGSMGKPVEPI